jgi:cardiolipin synthase
MQVNASGPRPHAPRASGRSLLAQALSVPNQLTMLRLLLLPFILIAMIYERHGLALGLFSAAALTDWIDGFVARHFDQRTLLGEFLDPIADKLFLSSCFVVQAVIGTLPWWVTILVLSRDVVILATVLVVVLTTDLRSFPPSTFGKVNTFVQSGAVVTALVGNYFLYDWISRLTEAFVWATAVMILLSSVHYGWRTLRKLHEHETAGPPSEFGNDGGNTR